MSDLRVMKPIRRVDAEILGPGRYRVHLTVLDLAESLAHYWPSRPGRKGRALLAAKEACLAALEGRGIEEEARASFIRAAAAADICIRE